MWRKRVIEVLNQIGQHPAWGVEHCRRVYRLAVELAGADPVDEEVVFAAAMVHDFGAYPPYRLPGADHAARSIQVVIPFLIDEGFPVQKTHILQESILGHMYDVQPGESLESRVIHDADTLDFLGAIGISRLLMLISRPEGFESLAAAAHRARHLAEVLPSKTVTPLGRQMAESRRDLMLRFLDDLDEQRAGEALELPF